MSTQTISEFHLVGIAVRTTNENGQSSKDIPALWNQFMAGGLAYKIPNKIDESIYCVYTDYEKDHTKPYTTLLACKVANLDNIPEGMVGKTIEKANYAKQTVSGNLMQVVFEEWVRIWNSDMKRAYTADFEVYGAKAQNPEDGEIDIFISIP